MFVFVVGFVSDNPKEHQLGWVCSHP